MKEDNKGIENLFSSFVFIGTPIIAKDRTKFYSSGKSEGGYEYHKVQFGVKTNEGNIVYCEMQGGYNTKKDNTIKTTDGNGNKIDIAWADRNVEAVVNLVSDMRKIKMNFESTDDRDSKMFLSEYDTVKYIAENLTADKRIVVIGNVKYEKFFNKRTGGTQIITKYIPQKIRLANENEVDKAELTLSFVFEKDSWNEERLKKEGKVDINSYVTMYDNTLTPKRNIFIPMNIVLDFNYIFQNTLIELTDEQKGQLFQLYKKYFTVKRNEYYETQWKCELFRGTTAVEITMDDLSQDEKMQIQFGIVDFDTIANAHRRQLAGDKINEIKLMRPTNKFENEKTGLKEVNKLTKYKEEDFFVPIPEEESLGDEDSPISDEVDVSIFNNLFKSN